MTITFWIGLILVIGIIAGLFIACNDNKPNARIFAQNGPVLEAEIICPKCGTKRSIIFEYIIISVRCRKCEYNITPTFSKNDQDIILRAIIRSYS